MSKTNICLFVLTYTFRNQKRDFFLNKNFDVISVIVKSFEFI